ncbi:13192_t:CDS:2, partial [Dentiscutata heterogama]
NIEQLIETNIKDIGGNQEKFLTKERLKRLIEKYDRCMKDLQFAITVVNEHDLKKEAQKIEESLNEVEEILIKVDIGVDNSNQKLEAIVQSVAIMQSILNDQSS